MRGERPVLRITPPTTQAIPLLNTETMLLIHDNQPEIEEFHIVAEQRMGADNDVRLPSHEREEGLLAGGRRHRPGDQPNRGGDTSVSHHRHQRVRVLRGQHLSGG